jgi:hypothetical protein
MYFSKDYLLCAFLYGIYVALKHVLVSDNSEHEMSVKYLSTEFTIGFVLGKEMYRISCFTARCPPPNFLTGLRSLIVPNHTRTHFKPVCLTAVLINISGM